MAIWANVTSLRAAAYTIAIHSKTEVISMSLSPYSSSMPAQPVLYQAEPHVAQTLHNIRDRVSQICKKYRNQSVRVQMLDGSVYEGVLTHCEKGMLYISVTYPPSHHGQSRGLYYSNAILPLVLYELLVITLLYT